MRRTLRAAALGVAVALLATWPAQAAPGTANQDGASSRQLRQSAEQARTKVDLLTRDLDGQLAARDQAVQALGAAVQQSVASEAAADDAARQAVQARSMQTRTAKALYRGGGPLTLYASVLGSSSASEALGRVQMAELVLSAAGRDADRRERAAASATDATAGAQQAARDAVVTVSDVSVATDRVERILREAQSELDALEVRAAQLEAAEQARAALEAARQRAAQATAGLGDRVGAQPVPQDYRALYQAAARRCPGMRWTLLGAVGQVESGHGRNNGPSSAGAVGPMQFMPATFASYGVDGDGDGVTDPWNPADAIASAADYLCEGGGGGDDAQVRRALYRYNRAQWYVDLVLRVEQRLVAAGW